MIDKTTLNFKTLEGFKCSVITLDCEYNSDFSFRYWNCGYIYVPICNVKFVDFDKLIVHSGITYNQTSEDNKFYILGFDCAHYNDSPRYIKRPRSLGYCKNELEYLSRQIKKMILTGRKRLIKNLIKRIKNGS